MEEITKTAPLADAVEAEAAVHRRSRLPLLASVVPELITCESLHWAGEPPDVPKPRSCHG